MTDPRIAICAALNAREKQHPSTDPTTGKPTTARYRLPTDEEAAIERAIIQSLIEQQRVKRPVPGRGKGKINA